jgi:hypothetical protein
VVVVVRILYLTASPQPLAAAVVDVVEVHQDSTAALVAVKVVP